MSTMVLLDDERIAAMPVKDCGEPLVDLRTVAWLDVDGRQADAAGAYARVRTGTMEREAGRVFRSMGLFKGDDIGAEAVAALAGVPAEHAEPLLELLVDAQLVHTHAPRRYRMHELLRLFARERYAEQQPDAAPAVKRLLHFYLATARTVVALLDPSQSWRQEIGPTRLSHRGAALDSREAALSWADAEAANLVAVVRQSAATSDAELTVALAGAVSHVLRHQNRWWHELHVCQAALEAAERSGSPFDQAVVHAALGSALSNVGQVNEGATVLDGPPPPRRIFG